MFKTLACMFQSVCSTSYSAVLSDINETKQLKTAENQSQVQISPSIRRYQEIIYAIEHVTRRNTKSGLKIDFFLQNAKTIVEFILKDEKVDIKDIPKLKYDDTNINDIFRSVLRNRIRFSKKLPSGSIYFMCSYHGFDVVIREKNQIYGISLSRLYLQKFILKNCSFSINISSFEQEAVKNIKNLRMDCSAISFLDKYLNGQTTYDFIKGQNLEKKPFSICLYFQDTRGNSERLENACSLLRDQLGWSQMEVGSWNKYEKFERLPEVIVDIYRVYRGEQQNQFDLACVELFEKGVLISSYF